MENLDVSMVMVGVFFSQLQTQRGGNNALFSWSCPGKSTLCLAASDGKGEEQQHSHGKGLTLRAMTVPGCDFSFYWVLLDFRDGRSQHKQWVNSVQIHSKKIL